MNFLYISPEFPPNYAHFIRHLHALGVRVWAVGEADFYSMPADLRSALAWYVRTNLSNPDAVQWAVDQLLAQMNASGQPENFDLVESHNEQWLSLEAFINEKYKIDGIKTHDLSRLKKKTAMKQLFKKIGLPAAKGARVTDFKQAVQLADTLGYPLILKPDEGVGAGGIHRIENEAQLQSILTRIQGDYLIEEFIEAGIVTYDGLTDYEGNVVFENSLIYGDGVLEYVLGKDTFFYVHRNIADELRIVGQKLVRLFDIRRKFFHFEFFKIGETYMPIEINCRPPGGAIVDMMNYSVDDDLYRAYARMIVDGKTAVQSQKKYYCCYIGRKDKNYAYRHEEILAVFGKCLVEHDQNPPLFRQAMGNERYIFRAPTEAEIFDIADFVLKKKVKGERYRDSS
ncbi:MAG: ATP-grasp domain-containing protein [Desulfobacterales bacterium]|nr:MAG: ATP-grasp domain-containing protein [Desulfobacterales bacterium]